tara:strand:+ start:10734 stop:11504 length:771 start_codon:yes stop_codon:yes gene_type:complete
MKILVVGDSCKDVFRYGEIDRLTPEAPVPVFNPIEETSNDGMAKNVSKNIESLGANVYTITNSNSIKKIRYVDKKSNQLVLRVDEHDYCNRIDKDILSKIKNNKCVIPMTEASDVDAIIISDYCKGFLEEEDIRYICESNDNVFVDTKKKISGAWIYSVNYLKINSLEYQENKDYINNNTWLFDKTIITKGNKGCLFQDKLYPTEDVPVKDISGAGDTFLAGLVVEYLKSNDIIKAIEFAQKCTTSVVQKHGVSTI